MADAIETHEACCKLPTQMCPYPVCGNTGRKVSALTLDNHITGPLREKTGNDATFCLNPGCEVVYCVPGGKVVRRGETKLAVTIKDPGDDVYVCYCFEFKRGDIRKDLSEKGKTDIPDRIRKNIQDGKCACESKNPRGACCLADVAREIAFLTPTPPPSKPL